MSTLKTLLKEYDVREAKYYAARELTADTYEAVKDEKTALDWDAATDALEEAEAALEEIDEQIAKAGWGAAVSDHILSDAGLTDQDIAYWEAEHQRACNALTE